MLPVSTFLTQKKPDDFEIGIETLLAKLSIDDSTHKRITSFMPYSELSPCFNDVNVSNICSIINTVRKITPFCATYVKKDDKNLLLSLIIDETATYILLKTHDFTPRFLGSQKSATYAIRVPVNIHEPVSRVCQLVNHDAVQADFEHEFELQKKFSKSGVCPQIYATHTYIKSKEGQSFIKKTAFVEAFDTNLYSFDPLAREQSEFRPLTYETLFDLAKTVAEHLCTIHSEDLFHGDICLDNIGTFRDLKRFLINDFGHARHTNNVKNLGSYGHLWYTAPELFEHKAFDGKACDIYAFAICLSQLIVDPSTDIEDDEPEWVDTLVLLHDKITQEQKTYSEYPDDIAHAIQLQKQFLPFAEAARSSIVIAKDVRTFLKAFINIGLHPQSERRPTAQELVNYCLQFKPDTCKKNWHSCQD